MNAWERHLELQTRLYLKGLNLLANGALEELDPAAALKDFNLLWDEFAQSAKTLENEPHSSDAELRKKLEEGFKSLSSLMGSLKDQTQAQRDSIKETLERSRQSGRAYKQAPRESGRLLNRL